jgi:hypothetical protein
MFCSRNLYIYICFSTVVSVDACEHGKRVNDYIPTITAITFRKIIIIVSMPNYDKTKKLRKEVLYRIKLAFIYIYTTASVV